MNTVLCLERLSPKHLSSSAQWVSRKLQESLFVIGGFSANQPFAPNSCPANCDNNTEIQDVCRFWAIHYAVVIPQVAYSFAPC